MKIRLWSTHRLAEELGNKAVSSDTMFAYFLTSNIIWLLYAYFGSFLTTPSSGWMYGYEALLVLVLTIFGLIRCRESYVGAQEDRLIEHCIALSVPLSIKLILFSALAYSGIEWGLRALISNITVTSDSPMTLISLAIKAAFNFYPFLIATLGAFIYYLRLATHLKTVAEQPNGI